MGVVTDNEIQNTGKDDVVGYNMEDGFSAVEAKTIKDGTFDNVATHETGHDLGGNHGVPDGSLMSAGGNSNKVHRETRGDIIWSAAGYSDKEGVYENTNIKNRTKKDIAKQGNEIINKYGL